ncbi:MAG: hypothetical protein NT007_05375 [Candidatus Kapabacteria bacterium]|nr:hypothetical protein [Candidatus Kapabacteria bacterium]
MQESPKVCLVGDACMRACVNTRNINVSVICANAGIPFHGAIGDSCIRTNDRNEAFETASCAGMTIIPNSLRK